jgi:3D (Asp-Asp-Asp) domain-containing protein
VERPEIIEILIQSLHCPPAGEQRVAYTFLRQVVTRPGEPLTRRARALLHIALYRAKQTTALAHGLAMEAGSIIPRLPRKTAAWARSVWDFSLETCRTARRLMLLTFIVVANAYFWSQDTLITLIAGAVGRTSRVRNAITDVCAGLLAVAASGASRTYGVLLATGTRALTAVTSIRTTALAIVVSALFRLRAALYESRRAVSDFFSRIGRTARSYRARIAYRIARTRASVHDRYARARHELLSFVARIKGDVARAHRAVIHVLDETKRHATRQVLPEGATPFVAAALVCLVLFVFGINSYFIVSDVNRKDIFIDLSRYEWGDEALASMLIGEGYDIYLQEKITEKRITELLASGKYYERVIRVTGYYSPLPDQEKYATGTYRGDIILNGRGIMGADTTPVYMGMVAAPPHMEYGTNIIIEDLGKFDLPKIYTVHDRGGAIKGNRLDIWVGKGEEAMKKAYEITGYYKVIVVGDK